VVGDAAGKRLGLDRARPAREARGSGDRVGAHGTLLPIGSISVIAGRIAEGIGRGLPFRAMSFQTRCSN
jgi:hypothetical protein